MSEPVPCTCLAFDEDQGYHVEADHRHDCVTQPPCGGCWGCMSMTVHYWNKRNERTLDG